MTMEHPSLFFVLERQESRIFEMRFVLRVMNKLCYDSREYGSTRDEGQYAQRALDECDIGCLTWDMETSLPFWEALTKQSPHPTARPFNRLPEPIPLTLINQVQ